MESNTPSPSLNPKESNVAGTAPTDNSAKKKVHTPLKFGTFQGVFTPTLLTILGVIMYLRGPWVVGNAGVVGAIGIITLATAITLFTALSMSSIVTNIRIKAGGAFSIIAQSLGLEAGGAIGIPLYIAQALRWLCMSLVLGKVGCGFSLIILLSSWICVPLFSSSSLPILVLILHLRFSM